jgi:phage shock protein A
LAVVPPPASGGTASDRPQSPDADDVLDAREMAFVEARSEGKTIKESAKAAKPPYPYSTARRLDDREDIRAALRKRAREAVDCGVRTLAQAACSAAEALKDVAQNGGTGDGPRVSAARACLELSIQSLKIDDVMERVEQLEARQGQQPGQPGQFRRN